VSLGTFSRLEYPVTAGRGTLSWRAFTGGSTPLFDNIHLTSGGPFRAPQNPVDLGSPPAGCPECIHLHWRWGKVSNLTLLKALSALLTPAGQAQILTCLLGVPSKRSQALMAQALADPTSPKVRAWCMNAACPCDLLSLPRRCVWLA
jgi:hypothetical protein